MQRLPLLHSCTMLCVQGRPTRTVLVKAASGCRAWQGLEDGKRSLTGEVIATPGMELSLSQPQNITLELGFYPESRASMLEPPCCLVPCCNLLQANPVCCGLIHEFLFF